MPTLELCCHDSAIEVVRGAICLANSNAIIHMPAVDVACVLHVIAMLIPFAATTAASDIQSISHIPHRPATGQPM